jgi:hypothetical protein
MARPSTATSCSPVLSAAAAADASWRSATAAQTTVFRATPAIAASSTTASLAASLLAGCGSMIRSKPRCSVDPAAITAAIAAEAEAAVRRDQVQEALLRDLGAPRYAADQAFRQYHAPNPAKPPSGGRTGGALEPDASPRSRRRSWNMTPQERRAWRGHRHRLRPWSTIRSSGLPAAPVGAVALEATRNLRAIAA